MQTYSPRRLLSVSWTWTYNFANADLHQVNYLYKPYSFVAQTLSAKHFAAGASILFIYLSAKLWTTGRRERGLPPGPPVVPFLGNALQFPKRFPHFRYALVSSSRFPEDTDSHL
jgi:hypothetical protein